MKPCKAIALILLTSFLIATAASASSANMPDGWPWRGISIDSFGDNNRISDVRKLAQANVNAIEFVLGVRMAAKYENLTPEAAWKKNLAWADAMLDECKRVGIVGILTFVQVPIDPALGLQQDSREFWESPTLRAEAVALAGKLAKHFALRGAELGAYEILNEPLVVSEGRQSRPIQWPQLREEILREIRRYDANRYVVITPGPGGETSGYKDFKPLADPRIIYGAHFYNPHEYTHQGVFGRAMGLSYPGLWGKAYLEHALQPLLEFKTRYDVPVWIGEFSAARWAPGANDYLADLIEIFDRYSFGWMYFSYNSWHGWSPFFNTRLSTEDLKDREKSFQGDDTQRWILLKRAFSKNRPSINP